MTKLKILFVNGGNMDLGGISTFITNYVKNLDKEKFSIDILVHGLHEGVRDKEIKECGINIINIDYKSKNPILYKKNIIEIMRSGNYDIVHSNCDAGNYCILKFAKKAKIKTRISHSHNTNFLTNNKFKLILQKYYRYNISKYATDYFACSEEAGIWLHGNKIESLIINNAFDQSRFKFNESIRAKIRDELNVTDEILVGNVARFDFQKNQEFSLKIIKNLVRENKKYKLVLIGDGKDRLLIEKIIEENKLYDNVILVGEVNNIYDYYSAMDLFILPSRFEGFGIVSIEAQLNGLPAILSTNVPCNTKLNNNVFYEDINKDNSVENWCELIKKSNLQRESVITDNEFEIKSNTDKLSNKYFTMKQKVTFLTNVPSPYRSNFYNELSKYMDVTVIYEASYTSASKFSFVNKKNCFSEQHSYKGDFRNKEFCFNFIKMAINQKSDHVIVSNYNNLNIIIYIFYCIILNRKYILNIDGGIINETENKIKYYFKKFLISHAEIYLSPSCESDKFLLFYGASKEEIHRYPFTSIFKEDIEIINEKDKKQFKKNLGYESKSNIISVGQLINRKGFDILISNWPKHRKDLFLTIVGSGELKNILIDQINELDIKNIQILDFMETNDLFNHYRASDLFILLTREDIWGLVINEAMSKGLPCITTTKCISGLELIEESTGTVLELNDDFDLESIIDSNLSKLNTNVLRKINKYTIENMAINVYETLMKIERTE